MSLAPFALQGQSWANYGRYAKANSEIKKSPEIVFMGDSITDVWGNRFGAFFQKNNYVGRGISGQVTSQMLLRFRDDVVKLSPKKVAILGGINDIAGNQGPIALEKTFENIVAMCDIARANGIEPIICSALPANRFWKPENPSSKVKKLNEMLKKFAEDNNFLYVDYYTPLVDENEGLKAEYARVNKDGKPDGVHPNEMGYKVMEKVFEDAIKSSK